MTATLIDDVVASREWPTTADGEDVRRWVVPLARDGVRRYVSNAETRMLAVVAGECVLPVTVNDGRVTDASYVVSPYTHYVTYLRDELPLVTSRALRAVAGGVVGGLGAVLAAGRIDRVVIVNNWLLSTNLYPDVDGDTVRAVLGCVRAAFPSHAVVFRSLNARTTGTVLETLSAAGGQPIISRRVHLFDACRPEPFRGRHYRRDWALIGRHGYVAEPIVTLGDGEAERIAGLYRGLYLGKYSRHNPAFTADFVSQAVHDRWLTLWGLRRERCLDGVVGFIERHGVMTTPLLGYDLDLPAATGLYRMLTALLSTIARERAVLLHRSAGAATFKRHRGAEPQLEYSVVFADHLPWRQRSAWRLLGGIVDRVGRPMLERYDR